MNRIISYFTLFTTLICFSNIFSSEIKIFGENSIDENLTKFTEIYKKSTSTGKINSSEKKEFETITAFLSTPCMLKVC